MEIKFRFWDGYMSAIVYRHPLAYDFEDPKIIPMQYTGFKDSKDEEIFDGDVLSDWVETDEGMIKSHQQVFRDEETGCWLLDNSFKQDKSSGELLCDELKEFKYEISGNIHPQKKLLSNGK